MKKKYLKYIIYTLLFITMSIIIFSPFIFNGRSLIMDGDASRQHFIIFENYLDFLQKFKTGNIFSWNIGLGADVISQYSYYIIGDPFAYIGLLFKTDKLKYIYSFLIILRIYFVGISVLLFCNYKKISNYKSLLMTIIYTFSAFILYASVRHPFFTNAAILFPLFLIGIEKLIKEDKKLFLTIICFLCIISNFYFCYMIFLLGFLYAILIFIFDNKNQNMKFFIKKIFQALLCFLVAFLLASIIMLPTIYTFLNLNTSNRNSLLIYPISYYKTLVTAFTTTNSSIWLTIGVSSLSLMFIPQLFKNYRKNKVELIYFMFLTLITIIPFLGSMMNGFSFPSNRWSFAYVFILSYIAILNLNDNLIYKRKELVYMTITVLVYFIMYYFCRKGLMEFCVELIFCCLILSIFFLQKRLKTKYILKYSLFLIICLNMCFNGIYLYSNHGHKYASEFLKYKEVDSLYEDVDGELIGLSDSIKKIKQEDKSFYRIFRKPNYYQNLGIMLNYKSGASYLSLLNGSSSVLSDDLNNVEREASNNIKTFDNRTKATTILGSKYYIVNNKNINKVPYGYEEYFKEDDLTIYKNKHFLSLGVFYDSYILKEDYDKLSPLEKENSIIYNASIEDNNNIKDLNISKGNIDNSTIKKLSCDILNNNIEKNNYYYQNTLNDKIEIKCPKADNSELYVEIKNLDLVETKSKDYSYNVKASKKNYSNSKKIMDKYTSAYYVDYPSLLYNLGYKEETEDEIYLSIDKVGKYHFDDINVYAVSMDNYDAALNKLNTNQLNIKEYSNNYVTGNIENKEDGILSFTTDYSKGWKVYVDGKEEKTFIVNNSFMAIKLEKGNHEITLKYETPYIKLAIIFTLIGFIGLLIIIFENKIKTILIKP